MSDQKSGSQSESAGGRSDAMPSHLNSQPYFCLRVSNLARADEYDFSTLCFQYGAGGVAEELKFVQPDLVYDPDPIESPIFDANVYFTERPDESNWLRLEAELREHFPNVRFELKAEEQRDWMEEWKKGFKPFLFSPPFWIIPSWCEVPPEAGTKKEHFLFVDPGMAFGTGTHETTRLAAQLLIEECVRSRPSSLIDVGTGTGILALVGQRLGATQVVGLDTDPEARRTARENLEQNRSKLPPGFSPGKGPTPPAIQILDHDLAEESGQYDIVVANIIDGVLTLLSEDLQRVLKPQGTMILSGVLAEREDAFYENFVKLTGLRLVKRISEGEWSAALLRKS